ncbi:SMI1/KNR4 family protein [Prosthecomicrobium hirschii]|uniref:SMI1/KNR4 family protein n=1 Tax=Prosthecodimorpha hirschii TaxID=665126 RepID=UPI0009FAA923|nr:SMI1/KNR4 family protein [Prosthecomicrobium hirschii]
MADVSKWFRNWHGNPGATSDVMEIEQARLGLALPGEYLDFVMQSNGGMGFVGDAYVDFWRIDELRQFNAECESHIYAPGILLFGTNGGNDGYGFDFRQPVVHCVRIPLIGMALDMIEPLGETFGAFLSNISSDQ